MCHARLARRNQADEDLCFTRPENTNHLTFLSYSFPSFSLIKSIPTVTRTACERTPNARKQQEEKKRDDCKRQQPWLVQMCVLFIPIIIIRKQTQHSTITHNNSQHERLLHIIHTNATSRHHHTPHAHIITTTPRTHAQYSYCILYCTTHEYAIRNTQ